MLYEVKMADFLIQQKITRMIVRSIPRIQNMKKPEKFTIGKRIEDAMCAMLEAAIDANMTRGSKRPAQHRLDVEKEKLRAFLDASVAPGVRLISPGLHEEWSKEIDEIGRLLGGWISSTK